VDRDKKRDGDESIFIRDGVSKIIVSKELENKKEIKRFSSGSQIPCLARFLEKF